MVLPVSLADAAAAFRDGELGKIETIKISPYDDDLSPVVISALMDVDYTSEVIITEKRVEEGYSATDAVVKALDEINIVVCLANPDYSVEAGITAAISGTLESLTTTHREKKSQLYAYQSDAEIVELQTHEDLFSFMLIRAITPIYDVDENYDCWFANISLREYQRGVTDTNSSSDLYEEYGKIDSPKENLGEL